MKCVLFLLMLSYVVSTTAQLTVSVSPPKVSGQKAVVPLSISNGLSQKVESARAAVFLLDQNGKMIGQGTRWVIGGGKDKSGLAAGATNTFHFAVTIQRPLATANLKARVSFNRVVLEGGKSADVRKAVHIQSATK